MSAHTRFAFKLLALAACATAAGSAAQAADNTRYVSIAGNDANSCTLAAPCLTLQRGIDATPAGGELRVLDSGVSASTATVSKSMTISGKGSTIFLGAAITIDNADAAVTLRDLTLNGQGTIDYGINIVAATAARIERCVVHNFTIFGIRVFVADGVHVFVFDSVSRDNGRDGLSILGGLVRLTVDNSHFDSNGADGIRVNSGDGMISRSGAAGNGRLGIIGSSSLNAVSLTVVSTTATKNGLGSFYVATTDTMTMESSLAHGNGLYGLGAFAGGIARISNSVFTENGDGIRNVGGTVETRQNNTVRGNGTDINGMLTAIGGI